MDPITIYLSQKQRVVVSRTEYKGKTGIDIRTDWLLKNGQWSKGSKQGVRFYDEPCADGSGMSQVQAFFGAIAAYQDEFGI